MQDCGGARWKCVGAGLLYERRTKCIRNRRNLCDLQNVGKRDMLCESFYGMCGSEIECVGEERNLWEQGKLA